MLFVEPGYPVIDGWKTVGANSFASAMAEETNNGYVRPTHTRFVEIPFVLWTFIKLGEYNYRHIDANLKHLVNKYVKYNDILWEEIVAWDYLLHGDNQVFLSASQEEEIKIELINLMDGILRDNGIEA